MSRANWGRLAPRVRRSGGAVLLLMLWGVLGAPGCGADESPEQADGGIPVDLGAEDQGADAARPEDVQPVEADLARCPKEQELMSCPDDDRDGHGDPSRIRQGCPPLPAGAVLVCDDCDDTRPAAHPGASELCNGLDDDCDREADEGFGLGEGCVVGVGQCRQEGRRACTATGLVGCSAVAGQPRPETCDGLDNDCNGTIDDRPGGCDCPDGARRACGSDMGACRPGEQRCTEGRWGPCLGEQGPQPEQCNGADDDCNGTVDDVAGGCACLDGEEQSCGIDEGECHPGLLRCVAGRWGECQDEQGPVLERCNTRDDDCDGQTDEGLGLGEACVVGIGQCRQVSFLTCTAEERVACAAAPGEPTAETCDGLDNDCNGLIDDPPEGCACQDGARQPCGTEAGTCQPGEQQCQGGRWGACVGGVSPQLELCNGLDDDCDGTVDNVVGGCLCHEGEERACGTDEGECLAGRQRCVGGSWGECVERIGPRPEACNELDDDCDGLTDEGLRLGEPCAAGVGECRRTGQRICSPEGLVVCDAVAAEPQPEVCDGLDNDCNGLLDDAAAGCECEDGQRRPCGSDVGSCRLGEQPCQEGRWGDCTGGVGPTQERCNGLDDDCNGTVDDVVGGCECQQGEERNCGSDAGECEYGRQRCDAGRWGECTGARGPQPEVCNGLDDDCDGRIDEEGCGRCPVEMAEIDGRYCIDRWEASHPDATAVNPGQDGSRAVSQPGVIPWYVNPMSLAILTTFTQACEAAGKRMCTPDEWFSVCTGPSGNLYFFGNVWNPEACNSVDTFCDDHCAAQGIDPCFTGENCGYQYNCFHVMPTGAFPECTNEYGLWDVNGNVWEIVPDGSARGYQVRGGAFNCGGPSTRLQCTFQAGWDALYAGFRCCKDPAAN